MNCVIQNLPKKELMKLKPLWKKLNQLHLQDSIYFKEHYQKFTFEKRFKNFDTIDDKDMKISIIKNSDKIVGYCIATKKETAGEIDSIYIDDAYRKAGYGKKLIDESINWLKRKKCKKIMVAVANGHENVFDFYKKSGFYPRLTYLQLKE
jgi:diamine N-acetyltransferase